MSTPEPSGPGTDTLGGQAPSGRRSLRWQLPLLISSLLVLVAIAVVWAAYRSVEKTLVVAGHDRAASSAREMASLVSMSVQNVAGQLRRAAEDPRFSALVRAPTEEHRQAAAQLLLPASGAPSLRRYEVWSADGTLIMELASPRAAGSGGLQTYPRGEPPRRPGIGELEAAGEFAYFAITVAIPHTSSSSGAPSGYLRRFGEFTLTGQIARLLGHSAQLKVGSRGGLWSDFRVIAEAPPESDTGDPGDHIDADRSRWVGMVAAVDGTPFSLWVAHPYNEIVSPANAFIRRILFITAGVVLVGALLARSLAARITRPLGELSDAAVRIAGGDFTKRVTTGQRDEIGSLAQAFNGMAAQLERDMAARQAAEDALGEREARFRALFDNNPLSMWVYDIATLEFLEVNAAAVTRYGYAHDEFLAMRITDIRPAEDVPRLLAHLTAPRPPLWRSEGWRHRLKSGEVIDVEVTSHTLPYAGRNAALVVAQDLTERRRLEAQFLQAQKMEAIGQLTGGVAHDFNNLLTAILGYADLLLEELPPGDNRTRDVMEIKKAGESAAALTSRLLSFGRKQMIEPRVIDLNELIGDTARMLERVVTEEIAIELRLAPDIGRVKADPSQIQQVIVNLVVNARDAMPRGGTITLQTANVHLDPSYASTHLQTDPGHYVMLAVSDTGTGMTPDVQTRLFEPFFTTKEPGKGTGLGLPSVYGIVKQSGGNIWVYSEPGRGTTFKVYLPLADAPASTRVVRAAGRVHPGTATILVVEDHLEILSLARRIFEREGFTVLTAGSGDEALGIVHEFAGEIDLMLSDVIMPGQSGPNLASAIRAVHPRMRVIYMSGYTDDDILRQGVMDGAAFVQKPFTPDGLLERVRGALAVS